MGNQRLNDILARAYPYCVAAPFAFLPFLPVSFTAVFITWAGIALGGALCVLAAAAGSAMPLSRTAAIALGAAFVSALWFSMSSLWAINPRIALYSPRGAAIWVMLAVWLVAGVLLGTPRVLRETVLAVAAGGSFVALGALWETATAGYERSQGYAAGFLENSTSSGTMFVVGLVAAVVGLLISKAAAQRGAYGAAALLCAIALVMSSSRAAWLGLIALIAFAAVISLLKISPSRAWEAAAIPVGASLLMSALGVMAATGVLGESATSVLASLGTDRDAIWRSAWAQFARSPVIGEGIGQFSATIQSGLSVIPTSTYDTHNTLISSAVGGGIIGLALVLVTFFTLTHTMMSAALSSPSSRSAALLGSLPVFLLSAGLFAWVDSAALLAMSALMGVFLGSYVRGNAPSNELALSSGITRWSGLLVGVGALIVSLVNFGPVTLLHQYGDTRTTAPPTLQEALALRRRLPEARTSLYLLGVLQYQLGAGNATVEQAGDVLRMVRPDAQVDVTLATKAIVFASSLGDQTDSAGFKLVESFVRAGAKADPASGIWYTLAAYDAQRRAMTNTAARYASRALEYPQDPQTRARLEAIVSGAAK